MQSGDTIAAISSATGRAARMIVRLSGPEAVAIAARLWTNAIGDAGSANYGAMKLRAMSVPAWLYLFRAPRSYTGEDSVELHIPGNPLLAKMVLEALLAAGARSAEPGEFTARAYFNGRLDLTEAEGVAATIAAGNEQELSAARRLLSGELARRLGPAIDTLADTLALLEVGIDFTDEDVTFLPPDELARRTHGVDAMLKQLLDESARFEPLTHEPTVVLVGRPNAGKSTLLNALAGHTRAVVSPIAGTTRDVLSAEIALPRGMIRLMDVAGLDGDFADTTTEANDQQRIDQKMREHALRAVEVADQVVLVRDVSDHRPSIALPRRADLIIFSKCDLLSTTELPGPVGSALADGVGALVVDDTRSEIFAVQASAEADPTSPRIHVSALTRVGIDTLRETLDHLCFGQVSTTSALALNARHVCAIEDARAALASARQQVDAGPEFVASELRAALYALGAVTGRLSPDDLLGRIFSALCIGK